VCGNPDVWKPSEKTPLSALACHALFASLLPEFPDIPPEVVSVVVGDGYAVGERLAASEGLPLISATGSTRMGRSVATRVASRLGRSLLELGGNNAIIVMDDATADLAVRAVLFGAVGTAGQRCTTTRRLILQKGIAKDIVSRLEKAYRQVRIGDPLDPSTLMGPLIDAGAADDMMAALDGSGREGGRGRRACRTAGCTSARPSWRFLRTHRAARQGGNVRLSCMTIATRLSRSERSGQLPGLQVSSMTNDMEEAGSFPGLRQREGGLRHRQRQRRTSGAGVWRRQLGCDEKKPTGGGRRSARRHGDHMRRATNQNGQANYSGLPPNQGIK
jgi:aldehyde dehydrogenase (NAD+)